MSVPLGWVAVPASRAALTLPERPACAADVGLDMPAADGCGAERPVPAFACRAVTPPDELPAVCTSLGAAAVLGVALELQLTLAIAQVDRMLVIRALRRRPEAC